MTKAKALEELMRKTTQKEMLIHAYMSSPPELMDCLAKYRANFLNVTNFYC